MGVFMQKSQSYAYVRVSSDKQNEARQLKEMLALNVPKSNIVVEKASGKSFNRSKYNQLLKRLNVGDVLYIGSIDRLGRDYNGIIREWNKLTKDIKVTIKVLDMPLLDTDRKDNNLMGKYVSDIVLLTLAFQAEQEWQNIKNRQKAGIAIAKEKGKHLGRPKISYSKNEIKVIQDWQDGTLPLNEAMRKLNRKKSSFYKLVGQIE